MQRTLAVILNHNMPEITDSLFEGLDRYRDDRYDLIVMDNGSTSSGRSRHTSHRIQQNRFWGGALNQAFQLVLNNPLYDSLLFLNNDIEINANQFVSLLRKELLENDFAMVSPSIAGRANPWFQMQNWGSHNARIVKWIDMQAPLIHRKLIEAIGQFDSQLDYGWGQELVCYQVCKVKGWKTAVCDHISMVHQGDATVNSGKIRTAGGLFSRRRIRKQDFLKQASKNYHHYFSDWDEFEQTVEYGKSYSYTKAHLDSEYPVDVLRWDLINYLIAEYGFKRYLEIGVDKGVNFSRIHCQDKQCVDPQSDFPATHPVTSDVFFESLSKDTEYDIVFIDGLHTSDQVIRDVENALDHLAQGGYILVHDCNPEQQEHQTRNRSPLIWTGDVWKAWMHFRQTRPDLTMAVVDTDWGVGVISQGEQHCYVNTEKDQLNFSLLNQNRQLMLKLISAEEFKQNYCREYSQAVQQGISFCIATNGKRLQKTLLEIKSIKETMQKASLPYEIIICGDVRDFESVEGVQLVDKPADAHQGLLAKLKNGAAEKAQYEVIVFADDDLLFDTNWGERLLEYSARQNWDVLGNRVLLPNGGRYWDRCTYDPHALIDYDAKKFEGTLYQSGGFWLIRKRVYEQEKWDSKIEFYADRNGGLNEDVEYSLRLQEEGYVISFDKENLVWHNDESYVEDVHKQRVVDMETAKNNELTIPPVSQRFLELQSLLLQSD